ncbi:MAG TPA: ribosome-associated translation inhibitor RaiA [Bryobacteraceae bacterium]|nr:ribosome-associated translation inhibitor RaiA [Bryobacteraceae bacterium]
MNVTWTGKQEFLHPKQKEQLDAKISKLAHLLETDGKGDKQARVVVTPDKNVHRAEITLNYLDHTIVGEHVDGDQFTALNLAFEKLERQMLKLRERRRDTKKGPREGWDKGASANTINEAEPRNPDALPAEPVGNGRPRIYRVAPADGKPMTAEEAVLMIDDDSYLVFRDAGSGTVSVLLRRDDGNFDLVDCGA